MSSKRPSKTNRIRNIAGSFKGKLSSLIHLSRAPTSSSIEMGSSSDNPTRWATEIIFSDISLKGIILLSISLLNLVPVGPVDHLDHAPTTAFDTEVCSLSPISVPVPKQLGSASGRGLETPPTVSDYVMLMIVIANYWPFSRCLWPPIAAHYRPYYLTNQNKISRWVA